MPIEVLLIEDNPANVQLMQQTFRVGNPLVYLHVVSDGLEAMAFLMQRGAYTGAPRPDLILLDSNLTKMDGREVLAVIKRDTGLRDIPIIVVTSSDLESDVTKSYDYHGSSCFTKPILFEAFDKLVGSVNEFWLTSAKLCPTPLPVDLVV
jgi:two-component system, chemotaxis family, response regulator Rcp1